ncbi:cold-shock protein [Saccharopolyspora griseoalba]|uniref:Cold-shock protein n=1 Tax=Saccharopolyspora griseoalba TaxID=1431848 RepID=A0ABW2LKL6_9PSEU
MAEGVVHWYLSDRGYGMITPDDGGPDLFVHHSAVQMTGYKSLDSGQRVSYALVRGARGPEASCVVPLSDVAVPGAPGGTPVRGRTKPKFDLIGRFRQLGTQEKIVVLFGGLMVCMGVPAVIALVVISVFG